MKKLIVFVLVFAGFISKSQIQICAGSSTTLTVTSPASLTASTYDLFPGPFTSTNGLWVVSPTVTTTYTMLINGTTATGTGSFSSVKTVTVFAQPQVNPTFTNASCTSTLNGFNLNLTFSPANNTSTYAITWSAPVGTIQNIPNCITNSATQYSCIGGISPGAYAATVAASGGCSVAVSFTMLNVPAPANFSLTPSGGPTYTINCYTPTVSLSASDPSLTYTWSSTTFSPINTQTIALSAAGVVTVAGTNTTSNCSSTKTIAVVVNTSQPSSAISNTFQNITCSTAATSSILLTANSPTVNITQYVIAPQSCGGSTFVANTNTVAYVPQTCAGIYTYALLDNNTGCTAIKQFTINISTGFPTYTLASSPPGYTVGCATTSVTTINIQNAATSPTPGGPVSYAFLPPSLTNTTGVLGTQSSTNVSVPGSWTVVVRDNTTLCETRIPLSILQNTAGPKLDTLLYPFDVLDCDNPRVVIKAISETPNISYNWTALNSTGGQLNFPVSTYTAVANYTVPATTTVLGTYTLTLTDNNNKCITTKTISIYQNVYTPSIQIASGGTVLTCSTPTIVLTNFSKTGIPPGSRFPRNQPVVGMVWSGPSPQTDLFSSTTYTAATVGVYSLTGKDLNNGCIATGTYNIIDGKIYPTISFTDTNMQIDCGANGYTIAPVYPNLPSQVSYSWVAPGTSPGSSPTLPTFLATVPGHYSLTVTNLANGCATLSVTDSIKKGTIKPSIAADKITGYAPLKVTFSNNSYSGVNSTSNIVTYWNYMNGLSEITKQASVSPTTTFTSPGTYTVTANITKFPCTATSTLLIKVDAPSKLEVPNVFTPNNDNVNDTYMLHTTGLTSINMKIYDRWGHLVYELESDTGNISWDGKNQLGVDCAEGTYLYLLKATGADGQTYEKKDYISLFR